MKFFVVIVVVIIISCIVQLANGKAALLEAEDVLTGSGVDLPVTPKTTPINLQYSPLTPSTNCQLIIMQRNLQETD